MRVQPIPGADLPRRVRRLQETADKHLGFGDPTTPEFGASPAGADNLAGVAATSHNGTIDNVAGTWALALFNTLDTPKTLYHNLDVPTDNGLNVRWLITRLLHSGATTGPAYVGTELITVMYEEGDTITNNTIELRCYARGNRKVSGFDWVIVNFFFIPAGGV